MSENSHRHSFGEESLRSVEASDYRIGVFANDLLRDFYQTFLLSQAETAIQPPLFDMLADCYSLREDYSLLEQALDNASASVRKLRPPKQHVSTTQESIDNNESGFPGMWRSFSASLKRESQRSLRTSELMLDDILAADQKYQITPRPRANDKDVHESILREYILGDALTGSNQLLLVRNYLRRVFFVALDGDEHMFLKSRYYETVKAWEANHPGQEFLDSNRE